MDVPSIPADTSPNAHAIMIERWKSMNVAERAQVFRELNNTSTTLAIAGIRHRHGDISDDDLRWHLAARRYGRAVADEVYGARPQG